MEQPVIYMAVIQMMGEDKNPNGTWAFQYAMHTKNTALTSEEGTLPCIGAEMRQWATIETKVNGCRAYVHHDRHRKYWKFYEPCLHKSHRNEYIPSRATAHITIRLYRQPFKNHSWWQKPHQDWKSLFQELFQCSEHRPLWLYPWNTIPMRAQSHSQFHGPKDPHWWCKNLFTRGGCTGKWSKTTSAHPSTTKLTSEPCEA